MRASLVLFVTILQQQQCMCALLNQENSEKVNCKKKSQWRNKLRCEGSEEEIKAVRSG